MILDYVWLDAQGGIRSKTRVADEIEEWSFDGGSTGQAENKQSDLLLRPVKDYGNTQHKVVLCEVMNQNGTPHKTNTRAQVLEITECLFGFEQEYTLYKGDKPLAPLRGECYCGRGYGRPLVEEHLTVCLNARLKICGVNAEVMPGQWEFQIGPLPPLECADQLIVARYLLSRLAENQDLFASLDPKPVPNFNGAGCHANFSTPEMRQSLVPIYAACRKLKARHTEHIENYGAGYQRRLTGAHETCSWEEFRFGVGDRTASVRIPSHVVQAGRGYLEDRRPGANCDPYTVIRLIMETCCDL